MPAEDEQLAAHDVGRTGLDDRIFVGQAGRGCGEDRRELRLAPEGGEVKTVGMQLLQHVDIPFQVELSDAVVGDGQRLGARVLREIQIVALHGIRCCPSVFTTRSGMLRRLACSTVLLPAMTTPCRSISTARPAPYARNDCARASCPRSVPRLA